MSRVDTIRTGEAARLILAWPVNGVWSFSELEEEHIEVYEEKPISPLACDDSRRKTNERELILKPLEGHSLCRRRRRTWNGENESQRWGAGLCATGRERHSSNGGSPLMPHFGLTSV